jgi:putative toxin-antitoxin system antitoxin component (TIGR02293 family)
MYTAVEDNEVLDWIGMEPQSALGLDAVVEQGLPVDSPALLKHKGLTFSEIAEIVISPRTLKHRKARGERLSEEETDRMVRVARTVLLAENVFGDPAKSLLWLRTPDERIGGRKPLSMLRTDAGARVVESMLWQIDEGVYS